MRLPKKAQYALLLCLYLARAGRAKTEDVSINLNLSQTFVEQIARALRVAGLIKSVRGPGGGYELVGTPTLGEVLRSVGVGPILTNAETTEYALGTIEERALASIVGVLSLNLARHYSKPITQYGAELVQQEVEQLNSVNETTIAN